MAPVGFPPFFRNFPLDERTRGGAESEGGDEPHPRIKFVWPYMPITSQTVFDGEYCTPEPHPLNCRPWAPAR
jgi:hypothetical protein